MPRSMECMSASMSQMCLQGEVDQRLAGKALAAEEQRMYGWKYEAHQEADREFSSFLHYIRRPTVSCPPFYITFGIRPLSAGAPDWVHNLAWVFHGIVSKV